MNRLKLMTLPFKGSQGRGGERPYQVHPDLELYQASRERFKKTEAVFLGASRGLRGEIEIPPGSFSFCHFFFCRSKRKSDAVPASFIAIEHGKIPSKEPEISYHISALSARTAPAHSWVYVRQYCAEIDEAARNRMELIVPELVKRNGVTEQLKAENQMEWVRQMNACKAQAEEVVKFELIYD